MRDTPVPDNGPEKSSVERMVENLEKVRRISGGSPQGHSPIDRMDNSIELVPGELDAKVTNPSEHPEADKYLAMFAVRLSAKKVPYNSKVTGE